MKSINIRFDCPQCSKPEAILVDYQGETFTDEEVEALTEYFKLTTAKRCRMSERHHSR